MTTYVEESLDLKLGTWVSKSWVPAPVALTLKYNGSSARITQTFPNAGTEMPIPVTVVFQPSITFAAFSPSWDGSGGRDSIQASYSSNIAKLNQWLITAKAALQTVNDKAKAAPKQFVLEKGSFFLPGSTTGCPVYYCSLKLKSFVTGVDISVWLAEKTQYLADKYDYYAAQIMNEYNFHMNAQQNDVLDQLIALHPTVTWKNVVVTDDSIFPALVAVGELFAQEGAYSDTPLGELIDFAGSFKFHDPLPTTPMSLADAKLFFAAKLAKSVSLIDDVVDRSMGSIKIPNFISVVKELMYVDLVEALITRTVAGTLAGAQPALINYARTDAVYTAAKATSDDLETSNSFYDEFSALLKQSKGYARGTYVLAPTCLWYSAKDTINGLGDLPHVVGVHKITDAPSGRTARNKIYAGKIEEFLLQLARGKIILGYPSDELFATFANAARGHGFNVVVLKHDKTAVTKAANYSYQRVLSAGSELARKALRALPVADFVQMEVNRSGMLTSMKNDYQAEFTYPIMSLTDIISLTSRPFRPQEY